MMQLNFDRLLVLSFGFMLLFTSFNTAQSLAGQVLSDNDFGNLGFYSLSVLYLVFGFSCFVSLPVVKTLGARTCLVIGALCYTFYVSTFILPAFKTQDPTSQSFLLNRTFIVALVLTAAAVNGFGASILWVSQGQYLSTCANEKNKGQFNSIFWAFLMCSGIIGNLMAAYVIVSVKQSTFYCVMTAICLASSLFFLLLRQPIQVEQVKDVTISASVRESTTDDRNEPSVKADVIETAKLLVSSRMLKLAPLIIWTALSNSVISSVFVPLLTDTMSHKQWTSEVKNKHCLLSLIGLGVGEIIGALGFGYIQDHCSNRLTASVCLILSTAAIIVNLVFVHKFQFELWFGVLTCAVWGVQDGAANCQVSCVLGFQFDSKTTPFSVFKSLQSFSVFAFILIEAQLKSQRSFTYYFLGLLAFEIFAYSMFICKFEFKPKDIKEQNDTSEVLNSEQQ